MTPQELISLRDQAQADPACAEFIATRDCQKLAEILSVGRTKAKETIIGDGTILEAFIAVQGEVGLEAGNLFLDWFRTEPAYRHVVRLMDRGELRLDKESTQFMLMKMVPIRLPAEVSTNLLDRAKQPHPYTPAEISAALYQDDEGV